MRVEQVCIYSPLLRRSRMTTTFNARKSLLCAKSVCTLLSRLFVIRFCFAQLSNGSINIILILGTGPDLGLRVATYFNAHDFKIAIISQNLKMRDEKHNPADLLILEDLGNPANMNSIFEECREHSGVPHVAVYNAKCSRFLCALSSVIALQLCNQCLGPS